MSGNLQRCGMAEGISSKLPIYNSLWQQADVAQLVEQLIRNQ
jgi:hypothetical protein